MLVGARRRLRRIGRRRALQRRIAGLALARRQGTLHDWQGVAPRPDLPVAQVFADIAVMHGAGTWNDGFIARGGPLWPDFDSQRAARFCRGRTPVDPAPEARPTTAVIEEPCLWGGFAFKHFGHFTAEVLGRVHLSIRQHPDHLALFIALPGEVAADLPAHIWDLLAWCGLPADRVRVLDRPVRCRTLRVMPQPEQLFGPAPDPAYLALLDETADRNRLQPVAADALYVARLGMRQQLRGGHFGESYLIAQLTAAGVQVMHPDAAPLSEQLARYAGARRLIFAEGSAVHGRQLLGRRDQRITVLNRRPGSRIAAAALTARATAVDWVEATTHAIIPVAPGGREMPAAAPSLYDTAALRAGLARAGIDLPWNDADFAAAQAADMRDWARQLRLRPWNFDARATQARLARVLQQTGTPAGPEVTS